MPEISTIVPLTLTRILVGFVLRKTGVRIGRKLLILNSLLGGLGSCADARAKGVIETVSDSARSFLNFSSALIERVAF